MYWIFNMLKSKFLAGVIATLITLIFLVGITLLLVLVFDVEPSQNALTVGAALLTIGVWTGTYKWLKPKDSPQDNSQDGNKDGDLPPRYS